jgi:hypothetical protein
VKATVTDRVREKLYGNHYHYSWMANEKHELPQPVGTVYCFVLLRTNDAASRVYLVPAAYVSWYVRFQHEKWLGSLKHVVAETPTRRFRICEDDPGCFLNNWGLLDKPDADVSGMMVDCAI